MSLLNSISINLDFEKRMLAKIHALNVSKPNGRLVCQKKGGRLFYACKRKTDTALRYIKKEDLNIVNDMKLARFVAETEKRLNANILLQEKFLAAYRPADFASVNALLPKAYQFHFDERMPYEGRIRKKAAILRRVSSLGFGSLRIPTCVRISSTKPLSVSSYARRGS